MKILRYGSRGPQTALLQLALRRAGFAPGTPDGSFGTKTLNALRRFQSACFLEPDGVAGPETHAALLPWYTGYTTVTVRPGDSFFSLAARWNSSMRAIAAANPDADPLHLSPGQRLTVPLDFPVVPTIIPWCSELTAFCCKGLAARYPLLRRDSIGESVLGSPLWLLELGAGENRVLYHAAHHGNEWITIPLLLRFTEELARALSFRLPFYGMDAETVLSKTRLAVVPCVNPDGVDLAAGALTEGNTFDRAREIAADFPEIPFPEGWKANILGTDPNLQYPAGWEQAREIKFALGFTGPAPRDYVGPGPLTAPESLALYRFTLAYDPALTLSYHTQGGVIYWKYLDFLPPHSPEIAEIFSYVSGYTLERTPLSSGYAGYKDWFILHYDRPGYTIEAGHGENPLPLSHFDQIYAENVGILTQGLFLTADT